MSNTLYWANELGINKDWAVEKRKQFLAIENGLYNQTIKEIIALIPGLNELSRYLLLDTLKHFDDLVKSNDKELKYIDNKPNINEVDIGKARKYPIEKLFTDAKGSKVNCVNHKDENPSMDIRNNFAYCYSCGWSGDSISVFMKINNSGFKAAVDFLSKCFT